MPTTKRQADVLVVCSNGGHLFDAVALAPAWQDRSSVWVSFDAPDVRSLLAGERYAFAHGPTNRSITKLLRNLPLAWNIVAKTRPHVLVTTGAGVAVPFAWVARLRGGTVIYVECAGRVDRPSLSARLIAPVATHRLVQWPELAHAWKGARYAGNVLFQPRIAHGRGQGRDVLVTVGTAEQPFDRLLAAVPPPRDRGERVLVQHGTSSLRPPGADCVGFLAFDELDRLVRSARAVVCHAGIGSIALALKHGRRPIVVPRLRSYGEAVDDHQVMLARRLAADGLVTLVDDVEQLPAVLAREQPPPAATAGPSVVAELDRVLRDVLDRR